MSIWFKPISLAAVNQQIQGSASGRLGIELTEAGDDFLRGRLPVDERTKQSAGMLHGGVSVVLAETLASLAANFAIDSTRFRSHGQEINANHIRSVRSGWVYGTARPLHLGRTTHVWDVRLVDEAHKLVCVSRVTMAVLEGAAQLVA